MHVFRHVIAWKLVDCPELGYTSADKPYPRGELRVKTIWQIPGYYKHPEARFALHGADFANAACWGLMRACLINTTDFVRIAGG